MTWIQVSGFGFPNPRSGHTSNQIHVVQVKNFGTVRDGPAVVSLLVTPVNPTCPVPTWKALTRTSLSLNPGKQGAVAFRVTYGHCTDPSLRVVDYEVTGRVTTALEDSNTANDSKSATQIAWTPGRWGLWGLWLWLW